MCNDKVTLHGKEIKVGDKVYSPQNGWGVVRKIYQSDSYPIFVEFSGNRAHLSYNEAGKYYTTDLLPSLGWYETTDLAKLHLIQEPKYRWVLKGAVYGEYFVSDAYCTEQEVRENFPRCTPVCCIEDSKIYE